MATRTNAQEERLATLQSVMNVIAILDQSTPRRAAPNNGFDLRSLLPSVTEPDADDYWDNFRASPIARPTECGKTGEPG
jgi:hypothetical protein